MKIIKAVGNYQSTVMRYVLPLKLSTTPFTKWLQRLKQVLDSIQLAY